MSVLPELGAPARYFPVKPGPLAMAAGLHRFGTDFGNGAADGRFFQADDAREAYLAAKRAVPPQRHGVRLVDPAAHRAFDAVVDWIVDTLAREAPGLVERSPGGSAAAAADRFASVAMGVQEDLAVVHRDAAGEDHTLAMHVSFPSGWRPERALGASFAEIHGPVPEFARTGEAVRSMVAAMIERGPYVRFVWTICADDHLDHHPEQGRRAPWRAEGPGYLRVERQVTVPFRAESAALFLIRTYLTPFASLAPQQRRDLASALREMPDAVRRYKGLDEVWGLAVGLLTP